MIKVGLPEKVTFNPGYKGDEEPSQVAIGGKSITDRKKQMQRPRGGTWLGCSKSKGVAAAEEDDELRGGSVSVEGALPQTVAQD